MNNENKCFDCGISLADAIALNGVACTIRALIEALNKEGNLIQIDEIKNIIYLCSNKNKIKGFL
ncbi:hypothetical protein [Phocoenobacter skyensis]|uniref:Uncharacterized protein n=1 Tax=Phocoenobacter skyensis TaxID=97481 RepID=A0A1H7Y3K2_9PAST|nr:hypothetical protein [Pasteurella skyensis]MDP8079927.1 hypothetical protein [Pasteurella skyensis]MDP8085823.1 hypothetical protein [Pasteurella skyensis]MDP8185733.1 hypothetical protein [Pasteurella skyensis]QLB22353.1 hypothetical protein A6B44_03710 [Pasteurella skyensis]SEM40541.1 hypothetical protein SAMN05444853_11613 [Pasteurella skyensis]